MTARNATPKISTPQSVAKVVEKELYVHKTRIHPNNVQASWLKGCAGFRRVAYNWALNACNEVWNEGGRLSPYEADKAFNAIKKDEFPWAYEYPSCVGQQSICSGLNSAFKNFYRRVKAGETAGFPKFKSKYTSGESFTLTNSHMKGIDICGNRMKLPKKKGTVKMGSVTRYAGRLLSTNISRRGDKWYAAMLYELETKPELKIANGEAIGIDMGVKRLATISDGSYYNHPARLKDLTEKKKWMQRKLSKMQGPDRRTNKKASKAWLRMNEKVNIVSRKIADVRSNSQHQISAKLCKEHQVICVEKLNLKGMTKSAKGNAEKAGKNVKAKSGLNREMLNAGLGELRRQIEYKSNRHDGIMISVDPKYTSQMCSCCGLTSKDNRKTQSEFECVSCGYKTNADENAAANILSRGLMDLSGETDNRARSTSFNDGGDAGQLDRPVKPLASAA